MSAGGIDAVGSGMKSFCCPCTIAKRVNVIAATARILIIDVMSAGVTMHDTGSHGKTCKNTSAVENPEKSTQDIPLLPYSASNGTVREVR
ncbi:hypothetical protein [Bradyrhizobium sp.]|uniref:hypothetical protein n=1 Tax=Bradyrhizobium sp. TaxID=376 RepID=UPI003C7920D7